MFETPHRIQAWARLARKKWYGANSGETDISAADFDAIIGHAVAVSDAPASVFAADIIAAYPDARVVLNTRRDLNEWHRSVDETIVSINESWFFWFWSFFNREMFWAWHVAERYLWPLLFRAPDGNLATAVRRNGKWIHRGKTPFFEVNAVSLTSAAKSTVTWFVDWCQRRGCWSGRSATGGSHCVSSWASRCQRSRFLTPIHAIKDGKKGKLRRRTNGFTGRLSTFHSSSVELSQLVHFFTAFRPGNDTEA